MTNGTGREGLLVGSLEFGEVVFYTKEGSKDKRNSETNEFIDSPYIGEKSCGGVPLPLCWYSPPLQIEPFWKDEDGDFKEATKTLGYYNRGNTCFLNSTLQAVNYIPACYLIAHQQLHSKQCERRWKGTYCGACVFEYEVITAWGNAPESNLYAHIGVQGGSPSGSAMEPPMLSPLSRSAELRACKMRISNQHCAHEFYLAMMRFISRFEVPMVLEKAFHMNRLSDIESMTTIYGQMFSHVRTWMTTCSACGRNEYRPMVMLDLLVMSHEFGSTLEECISNVMDRRPLGNGALCRCDFCKAEKVKKSVEYKFALPPVVLPIVFGRVTMGAKRIMKNNIKIDVPKKLDLSQYFEVPGDGTYSICSFVHHSGNHSFGHYVAYGVNRFGQWSRCDDSTVRSVTEAAAMSEARDAYILFYAKDVALPAIKLPENSEAVAVEFWSGITIPDICEKPGLLSKADRGKLSYRCCSPENVNVLTWEDAMAEMGYEEDTALGFDAEKQGSNLTVDFHAKSGGEGINAIYDILQGTNPQVPEMPTKSSSGPTKLQAVSSKMRAKMRRSRLSQGGGLGGWSDSEDNQVALDGEQNSETHRFYLRDQYDRDLDRGKTKRSKEGKKRVVQRDLSSQFNSM